jgi:Domain of unknown function (DUF4266)
VDWRSSSNSRSGRAGSKARGRLAALLVALGLSVALALGAAGCGMNAVRASEKEFLADRVMVFDANGQEASADDHIHGNREGAAGGRGTSGGGCGCN